MTKGFLMAENMLAILILFMAMISFSLILIDGHQLDLKKENETDQALAHYMMRKNKNEPKQVKIHDRNYQKED